MLGTLVQRIFNVGNSHQSTPDTVARQAQPQSNVPQTASVGTRVHGHPQASLRRKLLKSASQANDASIKNIAKDAWRRNAENLIRQRASGRPLSFEDPAFARAVNAAMLGVPALAQNETLAMAVIEQLYNQGRLPVKLKDLNSAANKIAGEFKKATGAAQRRNAAMIAAGTGRPASPVRRDSESGFSHDESLPQYPYPHFAPPSYSSLPATREHRPASREDARPVMSGRQIRSRWSQGDFSSLPVEEIAQMIPFIGNDDGPGIAPHPAGDYSALSDAELDELAPFLFQDDHVPQQQARHVVPNDMNAGDYSTLSDDELASLLPFLDDTPVMNARRPQEPDTAALRATLTDAQRDEAEDLIPVAIRYPDLLGNLAQYDATQHEATIEAWRNAMQLLVYYRHNPAHVQSPEEVELIRQRQQYPRPPAATLSDDVSWDHFTLRNTPGGGDCLVHALEESRTGREQSAAHILQKRQEIAAMRSANPEDPRGNRYLLIAALNDVAPQFEQHLLWENVIPEGVVSNQMFAAFQACPGMYSGTEMVEQWTMLESNRDKMVITIDKGHVIADPDHVDARPSVRIQPDVMAYRNGKRIPFEGALTSAKLEELLAQGHIVIKNEGQHWRSVCAPGERPAAVPSA
jgi:hypothetical protein